MLINIDANEIQEGQTRDGMNFTDKIMKNYLRIGRERITIKMNVQRKELENF